MKVDRLLEIIIYLLNHDNVSAKYLADYFNVSVRTIQRDMISISSIGIPVYSLGGRYGGYSILPTYKVKNANIRSDEHRMIIKALESLATSYTNASLNSIIEKYNSIIDREGGERVFWDFGVTKENKRVQDMNTMLEKAIAGRKYINFDYRNANGDKSHPRTEPLAIHYKWYAWYMFAYLPDRNEYRTYKVARMENIQIEKAESAVNHGDIEKLMSDSEKAYYKTCIKIEVHFDKADTGLMAEYFPDCLIEQLSDDKCRIFIDVPAKERLWKALLLSFGDKVKVAGPENYRDELIETAKKYLSNYDI